MPIVDTAAYIADSALAQHARAAEQWAEISSVGAAGVHCISIPGNALKATLLHIVYQGSIGAVGEVIGNRRAVIGVAEKGTRMKIVAAVYAEANSIIHPTFCARFVAVVLLVGNDQAEVGDVHIETGIARFRVDIGGPVADVLERQARRKLRTSVLRKAGRIKGDGTGIGTE